MNTLTIIEVIALLSSELVDVDTYTDEQVDAALLEEGIDPEQLAVEGAEHEAELAQVAV